MTVFRRLSIHFFERFFDSELEDETDENGFGSTAALTLLASPGLFLSLLLMNKYSPVLGPHALVLALPDQYVFVNYAMSVTGIVAVLKWDSLFPDRRDFANLAILPIGLSRILYAKIVALAALLAVFALSVNGASVVLFPIVVSNARGVNLVRFFAGHLVSLIFGTFFAFFVSLALIGLLMSALPPRWFPKVSRIVRIAAVFALLIDFLGTFAIAGDLMSMKTDSLLRFIPQVWFVGLSQAVMGRHAVPGLTALAPLALGSCAIAFAVAAFAYVLSYKRSFVRIPETLDIPASAPRRSDSLLLRLLDRALATRPFDRACIRFAIKTIFRSERHALSLGAWMGLAITLAAQALVDGSGSGPRGEPNADLLSIPLILCYFVLCSLRALFDRPAELRANWVFRIAARPGPMAGERIAAIVMLLFVTPIILVTGVTCSLLYGLADGLTQAVFLLIMALLLIGMLRSGFRKVPFTCARQSWKRNPAFGFSMALGGYLFFVSFAARIEDWMLGYPERMAKVAIAIAAIWFAWRSFTAGLANTEESPVIFEDERDPTVRTLDLFTPRAHID